MEFLEFKLNKKRTLIAKDAIKLVAVDYDGKNSKCTIIIGDETIDFMGKQNEIANFYNNFLEALATSSKITTVTKNKEEQPLPPLDNKLPNLDNCVLIVEDNKI